MEMEKGLEEAIKKRKEEEIKKQAPADTHNQEQRKYKCPDCKRKEMQKDVFTEFHCICGFVNHEFHKRRSKWHKT